MKRLAVFLAAVLIVGWVSPSLADDLAWKNFYVRLLDEDGNVIDWGFLCFQPVDPVGYRELWHQWRSDNGQHWIAHWDYQDDYGDYGCELDAWDPPGGANSLYGEFDFFYSKDSQRLYGHCEDRSGTKYSLYAEIFHWSVRSEMWAK